MVTDNTAGNPDRRATDHPQAAGPLARSLAARNIALAVDGNGQTVLVRPDSALVAVPPDGGRREGLAKLLDRYDAEQARNVRTGLVSEESGPIRVALAPGRGPEKRLTEERWNLSRVDEFRAAAAGEGLLADYNYVVIGAQTVTGDPLGHSASWAGDMAFVGQIYEDAATGQVSILSTAQPAPAPSFVRSAANLKGRPKPRILVLDTGLRTTESRRKASSGQTRRPEHRLLEKCPVRDSWAIDPSPGVVDDEDETFDPPVHGITASTGASTFLDFEAGHGTFIAGVITQACPDAEIVSAGVLSSFGDGDVAGVLATLRKMINDEGPFDIVVMSFGTNLVEDEPGLFGAELTRLLGDSLGVAAAGNQRTCRPYFPAALPNVIGVGALAADGRAWFSNFGGWVDACAPGVDVISTFFADFTEILDGTQTRQYKEWARWSGTSFSAPKVAAAIAQEMYLYGGTAKEAWKRLSTHKHFRYPDLGVVFNI